MILLLYYLSGLFIEIGVSMAWLCIEFSQTDYEIGWLAFGKLFF